MYIALNNFLYNGDLFLGGMNWTVCVICQQTSSEHLKCSLNARAYESFLTRANTFKELNQLPVPLVEGITVNGLIMNRAVWHKSCHFKFSQDRLERAKRKRLRNDKDHPHPKRARPRHLSPEKSTCIFCGKSGDLHEFRTLGAESRVKSMATDLQDTTLLAKLEGEDLIALDVKYHLACLTQLRNRHRSLMRKSQLNPYNLNKEKKKQARAFAKLITYIENSVEEDTFCFKFSRAVSSI